MTVLDFFSFTDIGTFHPPFTKQQGRNERLSIREKQSKWACQSPSLIILLRGYFMIFYHEIFASCFSEADSGCELPHHTEKNVGGGGLFSFYEIASSVEYIISQTH